MTTNATDPEEGLTITEGEAVPIPWLPDEPPLTLTATYREAAEAVRRVLVDAARRRHLVAYGQLGPLTGVRLLTMPNGRHARAVFNLVAVDCRRRNEPDLTSLLLRLDGRLPEGTRRGDPAAVWAYFAERSKGG